MPLRQTSCGIPDFRSPTGLYARLKEEHWELDDPQQVRRRLECSGRRARSLIAFSRCLTCLTSRRNRTCSIPSPKFVARDNNVDRELTLSLLFYAQEIYPSNFTPSPCHRFVKALENNGKLLRNYSECSCSTQFIDGSTRADFAPTQLKTSMVCSSKWASKRC